MRSLLGLAIAGAASLASCGGSTTETSTPSRAPSPPGTTKSNVTFADYAGTKACEGCHADHVKRWLATPMHAMTRDVDGAVVRAPWDGQLFRLKDDSAKLETVNGARVMTIASKRYGSATYRVTRVIGGHHREDYAGVQIASAGATPPPESEELVLPVSYVFATRAFRYKGYSVMVKERAGLRAGPLWAETCIFCHNTVPYLDTVLGAITGPTAPGYQGEVVDPLLPAALRAEYVVTNRDGFEEALGKELTRIGAPITTPGPRAAILALRRGFRPRHFVEVGIGCEACHLGAREHVANPSIAPSFEPRSAFLEVRVPEQSKNTNRVCARCHQVLFSQYEPTWEGGRRHGSPGGSNINSGEARDMMLGGCAPKLTCVACHDPHAPDGTVKLKQLSAGESDALCTRCHDKYAKGEALKLHSHHEPSKDGARCIACHMPKKNMSLDGDLTRYHRIGSPTDPARVHLDRPLECALCHTEWTARTIVETMERWYPRKYDRGALEKLYGSLDTNVVEATAERGKPHEQAVAFQLLGDSKHPNAVPLLAPHLVHPYPIVRAYAKRAIDRIEGAPIPVDIDREDGEIDAATKAWLTTRAARGPRR